MKQLVIVLALFFLAGMAWKTEAITEINDCTNINLPGEYILMNNISHSWSGTCINIINNSVIFNCGGNTINGSASGGQTGGVGIAINVGTAYANSGEYGNNSVVKNCIISDNGVMGLNFGEGNNWLNNITSLNNTFYDNYDSLDFSLVANGSIVNNSFYRSSDIAVYLNIGVENLNFFNNSLFDNYYNFYVNNYLIGAYVVGNYLTGVSDIFDFIQTSNAHVYGNLINGSFSQIYFNDNSVIYFNSSTGGNFWANLSETGYSQTCVDADVNGICDVPYNVTTNTGCTAGVDCGDNVDYLPLAVWPFPPQNQPENNESNVTQCVENWSCGNWSSCAVCRANIFIDTRICTDANNCNTTINRPQVQRISTTGYLALFLLIIIALATLSIGLGFEVDFLPIIAGILLIMVGGAMFVYQGTMLFSNWLAALFIIFGLGVILVTTAQED